MIILYDATFEGFISSLRYGVLNNIEPDDILSSQEYYPSLYDKTVSITTSEGNELEEFISYIINRLSKETVNRMLLCFLSEQRGFQRAFYLYLKEGLRGGRFRLQNLANPHVSRVNEICMKVRRECHRFYGLVRFQRTEVGIYYAVFEPDHNIITLIAPHFSKRMRDQDWIIHDKKREIAIFYRAETAQLEQVSVSIQEQGKYLSEKEFLVQEMWRSYFKNITIEYRKNPKLQKRFMPSRYWKYLTEKT